METNPRFASVRERIAKIKALTVELEAAQAEVERIADKIDGELVAIQTEKDDPGSVPVPVIQ